MARDRAGGGTTTVKAKIYGPESLITQDMRRLETELNKNPNNNWGFVKDNNGMAALKTFCREVFKGCDISQPDAESPFIKFLNAKNPGGKIGGVILDRDNTPFNGSDGTQITVGGEGISLSQKVTFDTSKPPLIDSARLDELQKKVKVYYDPKQITAEQVLDLQKMKTGEEIKPPEGYTGDDYKKRLESLASYVVMYGEVPQFVEFDGKSKKLKLIDPPQDMPFLYGVWPNLQLEAEDFEAFTDGEYEIRSKSNHSISEQEGEGTYRKGIASINNPQALAKKFKDIILLQAKVASDNGMSLSIIEPSAFFAGLKEGPDGKETAQKLFAQAVKDAAFEMEESKYPGLKAMFVNGSKHISAELNKAKSNLKIPVITWNGDSKSPHRAIMGLGINMGGVAALIAGDGKKPVGNGALGVRAWSASEERETNLSFGLLVAVFSGRFNPLICKEAAYKPIDLGHGAAKNPELAAPAPPRSSIFSRFRTNGNKENNEPKTRERQPLLAAGSDTGAGVTAFLSEKEPASARSPAVGISTTTDENDAFQKLQNMTQLEKEKARRASKTLQDAATLKGSNEEILAKDLLREARHPGFIMPMNLRRSICWAGEDREIKQLGGDSISVKDDQGNDTPEFWHLKQGYYALFRLVQEKRGKNPQLSFSQAKQEAAEELAKKYNDFNKVLKQLKNRYDEQRRNTQGDDQDEDSGSLPDEISKEIVSELSELSEDTDTGSYREKINTSSTKPSTHKDVLQGLTTLVDATDITKDVLGLPLDCVVDILKLLDNGSSSTNFLSTFIKTLELVNKWLLKWPLEKLEKKLKVTVNNYIDKLEDVTPEVRQELKNKFAYKLDNIKSQPKKTTSMFSNIDKEIAAGIAEAHANFRVSTNVGEAYAINPEPAPAPER